MTRSTLADLRATFAHVVARIDRMRDLDEAWREAGRLRDTLRELDAVEVAELRNRIALRMVERDSLSLAGLAKRISRTKGRAGQMVRAAAEAQSPAREDKPDA